MSSTLIAIVSGIYLLTSISLVREGKLGMAFAFLCYSFANIGLIIASR